MIPGVAEALAAGESVRGTTSPNPPVGAAIIDAHGQLAGVGATQPPGGAHAEVIALRAAGERARGGRAVVSLEPCNHVGRTGPCSHALVEAGVTSVTYLNPDPNPSASGGAEYLRSQGVHVEYLPIRVPALEPWLYSVRTGRPGVTLKIAQSLDGFTAASDGSSQWITGESARRDVHVDRARRDAIIVGTGTVLADNPRLTARNVGAQRQPRRVVVGKRAVPKDSHLNQLGYEQYSTIEEALRGLWDSGARDVLVEGGAGLAGSFLAAGYVDMVRAYVAPLFIGSGIGVLKGFDPGTLSQALRWQRVGLKELGEDLLIELSRLPLG